MSIFELLKKKFFPNTDKKESTEEKSDLENRDSQEKDTSSHLYHRRHDEEPAGKFHLLLNKVGLSRNGFIRRYWRRYNVGKILLIAVGIFVLLVGSYLFYLAKTTNVADLKQALKATTVIYDKNEHQAGSLYGQKGTYVELDAISDDLENAVIATEDRSFYKNSGINYKRMLLAVATFGISGGGSTITQQLAKNAFLTQDQTIKRKAREFFLALELTKKYSKKEILTMYLNNAYFGNGVWGVEDASQKYFGTSASQLTLDEAATLAGMLKGPGVYNPLYSTQNATNRRDTVLQNMVAAGKISQKQADSAKSVGMANRINDTYEAKTDDYKYPSYFDAVISEASSVYGISEKDIVNNGYKIYTELDQNYQYGIQQTFDQTGLFPTSPSDNTTAQAASVALDPKTGGVRGLVGRVNSTKDVTFRSYNYATQSKRSPGSTIKPLAVYTPAIASGWSMNETLPNKTRDFDGYKPSNYGGIETEDIPMYQALANSYNVPAVYTLDKLGINKAFTYGKQFGLNMDSAKRELGVALGGGVTTNPLEMARAYATFANDGVMPTAHLITRIETASGKILKKFTAKDKRVISKSVADKMTSMMMGTFSNGTGVNANVYGYTLAGKTGTTETDFNPNLSSDQWVIGYTPDVVISQWLGFNKTDQNHYLNDSSSGTASNIFSTQASYILPYTKGTSFKVKNAYLRDGIGSAYDPDDKSNETNSDSQSIIDSVKEKAKKATDSIRNKVDDSNIVDKAKKFWDGVVRYFR
ncbi:penicillin-binding protein PBP2A [Streptococcus macacae]|uniref:Penicillin-binding protein, 1A family n=1 Tax=Streptococcus macacae NCTC 11558 TaxID=764298 RepID=G5JV14_9STRE|nr:penicillin-binding protein PBP2A [Streptococcus macacae]EHJ52862.1 penicillin-binding protein, 1A family [Streptococcus macacae NCTC 11558]SUN79315.1 penicillin-binding protein 2A [Streptococcus macacae NCTC 11558]